VFYKTHRNSICTKKTASYTQAAVLDSQSKHTCATTTELTAIGNPIRGKKETTKSKAGSLNYSIYI
jgi:hypothetical protein